MVEAKKISKYEFEVEKTGGMNVPVVTYQIYTRHK
jgi:hypothetical protein